MKQEHRKRLGKGSGIKFLIYPVAFFLLSVLIITAAVGPIAAPYLNMLDLVFMQQAPDFDSDAANIYTEKVHTDQSEIRRSDIVFPSESQEFGRLLIPSVDIDVPLIYGDGPKELKRGACVYMGTYLPGQNRTVLIAGHNNSYFLTLKNVQEGDMVEIRTNYAVYTYRITGKQIARHDDASAYDLTRDEENLILYTCHNEVGFGATPWRQFVYAEYVSGPMIVS